MPESVDKCDRCGCEVDSDDIVNVPTYDDSVCQTCYDENYYVCEGCGCPVSADDAHIPDNICDAYCQGCYDNRYTSCHSCGYEVSLNYNHSVNGDDYCESCFCDNFTICEGCEEYVSCEDSIYSESRGASYCQGCVPRDSEFDPRPFRPAQSTYDRIRSARKFGVELETSECDGCEELDGRVHFDSREDGSITGMEFTSTVLYGDAGLDAIDNFCCRAGELGFSVDSDCGFHAHFDVSDLTPEQLRIVAYAYYRTQAVWQGFVSSHRRGNNYCAPIQWDIAELLGCENHEDFRRFAGYQDRYQWLNIRAYLKHCTFEVRIHSATLNSEKVTNWVKAHARFIDRVSVMTKAQVDEFFSGCAYSTKFQAVAELWDDIELSQFYRARARKFGARFYDSARAHRVAESAERCAARVC